MSAIALRVRVGLRNVQLPGAVTELGTGLADVEVADLQRALLAFNRMIAMQHAIVMKLSCGHPMRLSDPRLAYSRRAASQRNNHRVTGAWEEGYCYEMARLVEDERCR